MTVVSAGGGGDSGGGPGDGSAAGGGAGGGGTGGQAAPSGSSGGSGAGAPSAAGASGVGGSGASGASGAGPALTTLDGPQVPDDAPALFEEAAEANGVTEDGDTPGAATVREADDAPGHRGDDPGPLATVARVVLGAAALGGVPVALAISRRPPRVAREGFPWPQPSQG